jgi:hypothetical protein
MVLWRRRHEMLPRATLAGGALLTAGWSFGLLNATPTFQPWLRWAVLFLGLIAAGLILLLPEINGRSTTIRRSGVFAAALLTVSAMAGPVAYSVDTISTAHAGALPSAGPVGMGGRGGFPGGGGMGGGRPGGGMGARPGQGTGNGAPGTGTTNGTPGANAGRAPRGGGMGGILGGAGISEVSSQLITMLQQGAKGYTWAAAAITSNGAAPVQIAAKVPVMAIGGFNGTDPAPTLSEFQQLVAQGKVHYFIGATGRGGLGGGGDGEKSNDITTWVQQNFKAQTVGSSTVYDLTTG